MSAATEDHFAASIKIIKRAARLLDQAEQLRRVAAAMEADAYLIQKDILPHLDEIEKGESK